MTEIRPLTQADEPAGRDVTYPRDLCGAPAARGTGAGRARIEAVCAAADSAGKPLSRDFNLAARRPCDRIAIVTPFIRYRR